MRGTESERPFTVSARLSPGAPSVSSAKVRGQKELALQTVLVEPVRRVVRGHHHDHPGVEECREETPEDHCVGDVVDLKFVEAQQRRLTSDVGGDLVYGLGRLGAALPFDTVVHFEHEGMEVDAPLMRARHRGEEQIHQHRFAAPDRTPQIEPSRHGRRVLDADEARQAPASGRRLIRQERLMEPLQSRDCALLRRVGANDAGPRALTVELGRPGGAGAGSGFREGRSRGREIDGHSVRKVRK